MVALARVPSGTATIAMFQPEMATTWPGEIREIRVGRLELSEARALASSLIGPSVSDRERAVRAVVREACGSPLLIQELVRTFRDIIPDGQTLGAVTLDHVIAERLEARRMAALKGTEEDVAGGAGRVRAKKGEGRRLKKADRARELASAIARRKAFREAILPKLQAVLDVAQKQIGGGERIPLFHRE